MRFDVRGRGEVTAGPAVRVHRVYDGAPAAPGQVYLVERLWPRGLRRDQIAMNGWLKDAAPSTELRRWFAHDRVKWPEFRRRYAAELDANPQAWHLLLTAAGDVTLLYSAQDRDHNSAVALRAHILARRGASDGATN